MKIYRVLFTLILLGSFTSLLSAQSLSFCEKLDGAGNPVNVNSVFTVGKNGSPVVFYFVPAQVINAAVSFDVYAVNEGKEVFRSTLKQAGNGAKPVSKQMTFYDAGHYRIYVFDENDKQLAKGDLTIRRGN